MKDKFTPDEFPIVGGMDTRAAAQCRRRNLGFLGPGWEQMSQGQMQALERSLFILISTSLSRRMILNPVSKSEMHVLRIPQISPLRFTAIPLLF